MSNEENIQAIHRVLKGCLAASIGLLIGHYYYYCRFVLEQLHWAPLPAPGSNPSCPRQLLQQIMTRLVLHVEDTGLFRNSYNSRLLSLLCLIIFLVGVRGRKDQKLSYRGPCIMLGIGLVLLLGQAPPDRWLLWAGWLYILLTATGYLLILTGGIRLSRILHGIWQDKDPFGRKQAGFPQEERLIAGDFSINLPARYTWRGKEKESWINVINPRRGIFIMGSPGSGKSWFIIEPIIRQLIAKGFALFLYDFKYDQLTRLAYGLFQHYRDRYPASAAFYTINFSELSRSHRCNVLDPRTLEWLADAIGASRTILLSMNKTWVNKQGDFFVESPINYLAAIIWFLRKYEDGKYCTLPHAIELAQQPYEALFNVLKEEPEITALIKPFSDALANKSMEMLDSQVASARIPLARLSSPDFYYILSGNDVSLDINDPAKPKVLCLGGDPPRQEALAPILSLYIDRLNKLVNRPGRHRCALICDEFATVRAYSMSTTIATARSNDIIPVITVQDLSQLRTRYSRDEADQLLNISGNLFCGQVGGETARWISERFPRILQDKATVSINSSDTSISHSQQWEPTVLPSTIATLSSGEFLGMVTDDPSTRLDLKAFHAKLVREEIPLADISLPVVREIKLGEVEENFRWIREEVAHIVNVIQTSIVIGTAQASTKTTKAPP